jgi:hypothetical protein
MLLKEELYLWTSLASHAPIAHHPPHLPRGISPPLLTACKVTVQPDHHPEIEEVKPLEQPYF